MKRQVVNRSTTWAENCTAACPSGQLHTAWANRLARVGPDGGHGVPAIAYSRTYAARPVETRPALQYRMNQTLALQY